VLRKIGGRWMDWKGQKDEGVVVASRPLSVRGLVGLSINTSFACPSQHE